MQSSKLASVLRMINRGEFLRVLRPSSYTDPVHPGADRPPAIITLGKAIVVLYLGALMAAMISARMLPEEHLDRPDSKEFEVSAPPPIVLDS